MEIVHIPFAQTVGIGRHEDGSLNLPFRDGVLNHVGGVHASAQFALAETASGDYLYGRFPELAERVVALLRDARVKFRQAATGALTAHAEVTGAAAERFLDRFSRKGRASVTVDVELRDRNGAITRQGHYEWYVQRPDR